MVSNEVLAMSESQLEAMLMRNMSTMHALRLQRDETLNQLVRLSLETEDIKELLRQRRSKLK